MVVGRKSQIWHQPFLSILQGPRHAVYQDFSKLAHFMSQKKTRRPGIGESLALVYRKKKNKKQNCLP